MTTQRACVPADDWGDIIPPYDCVDAEGERVFPGSDNWGAGARRSGRTAATGHAAGAAADPITPTFECVEPSGDGFIAHFGYDNPNSAGVTPLESENYFSPDPRGRNQPTTFQPGSHPDAVKAPFTESSITWHLTGKTASAGQGSTPGEASITVVKNLGPSTDPGKFDLKIDGDEASGVGHGGTTGSVAVDAGGAR